MAENTQVANFNTQLSYYTNRYVDLMERDLTSRGMEFDSYSKDCVVAAMGSIFQMVHESGVNFDAINGSNLKFILSKVASLKLNANAQPRECYRDGIQQGKKTLARDLSHIIDTHLQISLKPEKQNNKTSIKAFEKFREMLDERNYEK